MTYIENMQFGALLPESSIPNDNELPHNSLVGMEKPRFLPVLQVSLNQGIRKIVRPLLADSGLPELAWLGSLGKSTVCLNYRLRTRRLKNYSVPVISHARRDMVVSRPEGDRFSQWTLPWQTSMQVFTIANPSPPPPVAALRDGSTR